MLSGAEGSHIDYVSAALQESASSAVLGEHPVQTRLLDVNRRIRQLESEIRQLVLVNQDELLAQAQETSSLKSSVAQVSARVSTLSESVARIRTELITPLEELEERGATLKRITVAKSILRRVQRLMYAIRRLKLHVEKHHPHPNSQRELIKSCSLLSEVEQCLGYEYLRGVRVVQDEEPWIKEIGRETRDVCMTLFTRGAETLDQADVASAAVAFHHIGMLPKQTMALIHNILRQALERFHQSLSLNEIAEAVSITSQGGKPDQGRANTPGRALQKKREGARGSGTVINPPVGAAKEWREQLWTRLNSAWETLLMACIQVWHVERVLWKKLDAKQQQPLLHIIMKELQGKAISTEAGTPATHPTPSERIQYGLYVDFWMNLTSGLKRHIDQAVEDSAFIRDTLVARYPAIHGSMQQLLNRLWRSTGGGGRARRLAEQHDKNGFGLGSTASPPFKHFPDEPVGRTSFEASRLWWSVSSLAPSYAARSLARTHTVLERCLAKLHEGRVEAAQDKKPSKKSSEASQEWAPEAAVPDESDVNALVLAISSELRAVRNVPELLFEVARGSAGVIKTLLSKLDEKLRGSRLFQPRELATPAAQAHRSEPQRRIQTLLSSLMRIHKLLTKDLDLQLAVRAPGRIVEEATASFGNGAGEQKDEDIGERSTHPVHAKKLGDLIQPTITTLTSFVSTATTSYTEGLIMHCLKLLKPLHVDILDADTVAKTRALSQRSRARLSHATRAGGPGVVKGKADAAGGSEADAAASPSESVTNLCQFLDCLWSRQLCGLPSGPLPDNITMSVAWGVVISYLRLLSLTPRIGPAACGRVLADISSLREAMQAITHDVYNVNETYLTSQQEIVALLDNAEGFFKRMKEAGSQDKQKKSEETKAENEEAGEGAVKEAAEEDSSRSLSAATIESWLAQLMSANKYSEESSVATPDTLPVPGDLCFPPLLVLHQLMIWASEAAQDASTSEAPIPTPSLPHEGLSLDASAYVEWLSSQGAVHASLDVSEEQQETARDAKEAGLQAWPIGWSSPAGIYAGEEVGWKKLKAAFDAFDTRMSAKHRGQAPEEPSGAGTLWRVARQQGHLLLRRYAYATVARFSNNPLVSQHLAQYYEH